MPASKVSKKIKTLSKRGGVKSKQQEFANDMPPRHRLSQTDVQRTMAKDWDRGFGDYQTDIDLYFQQYIVEDENQAWYERMDLISYQACGSLVVE